MAGKFGRTVYRDPRWQVARLRTLNRDNWRCRTCGKAGVLEVHHYKQLADGGDPFDVANLRSLCRPCHFRAHRSAGVPGRAAWRLRIEGLAFGV